VFPDVARDELARVLVVPTYQPSCVDLVGVGEEVEAEKDRLLHNFNAWADKVIARLAADGYWADTTDPCSGMPTNSRRGSAVFDDVAVHERLLHYATHTVGGASGIPCKVISHPTWGSRAYPATLFAIAPLDALQKALGLHVEK